MFWRILLKFEIGCYSGVLVFQTMRARSSQLACTNVDNTFACKRYTKIFYHLIFNPTRNLMSLYSVLIFTYLAPLFNVPGNRSSFPTLIMRRSEIGNISRKKIIGNLCARYINRRRRRLTLISSLASLLRAAVSLTFAKALFIGAGGNHLMRDWRNGPFTSLSRRRCLSFLMPSERNPPEIVPGRWLSQRTTPRK